VQFAASLWNARDGARQQIRRAVNPQLPCGYARRMSSDPIADMADSLDGFTAALRNLVATGHPAPGSPAVTDAAGEPYAGAWGDHPSQDGFPSVLLLAWSCYDHLSSTAAILRGRGQLPSLYTLVRGAAEAAATACYLSEEGIDPRERVRRYMNWRLDGLCEQINMIRPFAIPEASAKVAQNEQQIADICRGGRHHGLKFQKQQGWRSAYLGDKPPSAMALIDECASETPGLGAVSQRLLSAVAHAQLHGLTPFISREGAVESGTPGQVLASLNIKADSLALQLMAGPLCASSLVVRLRCFAGWDSEEIGPSIVRMLTTWGRIAGTPYPGPEQR
jgi:hypothetical protein